MDTERKNNYYKLNNKYINPRSERDDYDEYGQSYIETFSR